jgi:amino acid transporter
MLYRNLANLKVVSLVLWGTVLGTIGWVLVTALLHGHLAMATTMPEGAFRPNAAFFSGLASAMLIATYDFWGYYNITFLGAEVRDPARTIPRAILLSIGCVGVLYLGLNMAVLAVLPWQPLLSASNLDARRALISVFMQTAYGAKYGHAAGVIAAVLVMITAFASVFSLLLGYSRIPYAAALDGSFFRAFGRLHPTRGFPYVSLLYLGGAAAVFCFFSLGEVIAALVVIRILLQFVMQHVGVMVLRRMQPDLPRPFRMWFYPLPPLLALAGFIFIVFKRTDSAQQVWMAAVVVVLAGLIYWGAGIGKASFGRSGA